MSGNFGAVAMAMWVEGRSREVRVVGDEEVQGRVHNLSRSLAVSRKRRAWLREEGRRRWFCFVCRALQHGYRPRRDINRSSQREVTKDVLHLSRLQALALKVRVWIRDLSVPAGFLVL